MKKDLQPYEKGEAPFIKTALMLAIPIALQNMLTASFSLIDTLMVGQLGELALASVGRAGQWSWLLNMATFGITSGAAVFVSQYWGENNKKGIPEMKIVVSAKEAYHQFGNSVAVPVVKAIAKEIRKQLIDNCI